MLVALSLLQAHAAIPTWTTSLEATETSAGYVDIAAWDDGTAAVTYRAMVPGPAGDEWASQLRRYDGVSWDAPVRFDEGMPEYDGEPVHDFFVHRIAGFDDGRVAVVVNGRYHDSIIPPEGLQYGLFLRIGDGVSWDDWLRVSPVGVVNDPAVAVDSAGVVWFAWRTSTNLDPGDVMLSSYDSTTGSMGPTLVVDAASTLGVFQGVQLTIDDADTVWVTYNSPDGLYARAVPAAGPMSAPELITSAGWALFHDAAWMGDQLWVATDEEGVGLYRGSVGGFAQVAPSMFSGGARESATRIEERYYNYPSIASRGDGSLAVSVVYNYYFENYVTGAYVEETQVVVRESRFGRWGPEQVAYPSGGWNNTGGAMTSGGDTLWVGGGELDTLFLATSLP